MKSKIVTGTLLGGVITLMSACNTNKEEPPAAVVDTAQIKTEIQAKEDEFAAVYNANEPKSIGYYADDATSFFQNRPALVGKQAIVTFLMSNVSSNSNKISFKTNEVFPSNDGNQVVEIGYYTVTDSTNTPINTGNYMVLFKKTNGKYQSFRDMSASDMPLQ